MVPGPRYFGRPTCFDGDEEGRFDEWRSAVPDELALRATLYQAEDMPPDVEGQRAFLLLYSVVVSCIKSRFAQS